IPCCIKYFPGVVLNVVLSSATEHIHVDSSMGAPSMVPTAALNSALTVGRADACADRPSDPSNEDKFVEGLRVASALTETPISDIGTRNSSTYPSILPPSSPSKVKTISKTALSFVEVAKLASKKAKESAGQVQQQELSAQMAHMIKLQEASDAKQEKMNQLQKQALDQQEEMKQLALKHQEEMRQLQKASDAKQEEMKQLALDHHEEIKQLQIQALGQLAVLQDRVKAVLTQTYELHEYPIPRLFVVLPQDPSRWDIVDPFSNKFRLYFLCECGEHTKSIDSKTEIHFAKHEGYEIARPSEFFQLYGSHVLAILKMLKFGISVAGVAVPAISHLVRADAIDQAATYLQLLKDIEPMMDPVIDWMDKVSVNEGEAVDEFAKQMENKEALAGADLRKLDTFLKTKDGDKVLGNLYRTVTDEGHVKWVCIDHYCENYQESTAKDFQRMLDSVGGSFDKSIGRVEVKLQARVLAEQFSLALGKARSVYELDMDFDWACTMSDLEVLEGALKTSRVSILRLDLRRLQSSFGTKLFSTSAQFGALFRFSELPNMKKIHIVLPQEFVKILSFRPAHPHKLSFELLTGRLGEKEFGILAKTLRANSTLTILNLQSNSIGANGAQALAEALKTNSTLTTLNLDNNLIGDNGAQALAEVLKTNSTLTTLNLDNNRIGDNGAQALAEALKTNSTLTTLNLQENKIWYKGLLAFSEAFKSNTNLSTLDLRNNLIENKVISAWAEKFKTNSTLTTLNLDNNEIEGNGARAQALAEALKTNSTLTTLNLKSNGIGANEARALAEALKTNSTLTTLNLDNNLIGDNGTQALAEALKTNSTLTTLELHSNSIEKGGAQALARALKTNSTLTTLELYNNRIGHYGAWELAEALKTNSTLTTLGLYNNSVENGGAQALARALKTNSTLTTLSLTSNFIEKDGAQALAETLKTNSTLTSLNVNGNSIGDNGAQALAEALKTNSTLTILNLESNSIGANGAQALAEALMTNSTLTILSLKCNSIGKDGAQVLDQVSTTTRCDIER
ncbi:hypothetical protein BGZ59_002435, partial [Podila verticillata]